MAHTESILEGLKCTIARATEKLTSILENLSYGRERKRGFDVDGWAEIRVSEPVRELRPVYLPPDPVSRRTYATGEIAQCDFWFPDVEVPSGADRSAPH